MTNVHSNHLVADYLRRLNAAAAVLPAARRAELVAEIREHIDEAIRETGAADEVVIRNILERLGPPEEIVAAAGVLATDASPDRANRVGGLEIAALVVLAVGGILPVIGWLVGVVLVAVSGAWSTRDKAVGMLLGLLPTAMLFTVLLITPGSAIGPVEFMVLSFGFVAGVPSALYLAWRLRRTPRDRALVTVDRPAGQGLVSSI